MDLVSQLNSSLGGRYAIDREIGRGGMATVYLARDLRHDRRVALKLLSPELGAVVGVDRFLAEIKVTANLQHPNLLPLFDSGEADGQLFYVMPFVEGETLRAKLQREKQLPVGEAVRIATAVASALSYAHAHGVIHRDLKPENILMQSGHPMVADFGIALAVSNAGGARITQTGLSLGTPQYMSPEQATGDRSIDGRSDIYSLGAVLYEMLVGDPPHLGGTAQAIIAKVLTERPPSVRTARPTVPPHVEGAVARALEKLPADRFVDAQEFADALSSKLASTSDATAVSGAARVAASVPAPARRFSRATLRESALVGLWLATIGFGIVQWRGAHHRDSGPVIRLQLVLPRDQVFTDALNGASIAISPQGDRIAYRATGLTGGAGVLWVRPIDQIESRALTPPMQTRMPCFSPDGRWVAFADGTTIKKVSVEGGPVTLLATLPDRPYGLAWGPAGFLVAAGQISGLYLIPEQGGPARHLPTADGEGGSRWPIFLPDGKAVIYQTFSAGGPANGRLTLLSLADGKRTPLSIVGATPIAVLDGQLIYATLGGTLMAAPFDGTRAGATAAVPLVQDVVTDGTGGVEVAVSATGTLVYRSGRMETEAFLVGGATTPIGAEPRSFSTPRFSPDGKQAAFTVFAPEGTNVWVFNRARSTLTKITSEGNSQRPEWTPDGKRLLFVSDRAGGAAFYTQPADGSSASAELLYKPVEGDPFEALLSPDGHWLVYRTGPAASLPRSILAVELGAGVDRKSIPIVTGTSTTYAQMPRLSPDGHWLAYQSNETGPTEIYVRPFPGAGARTQVSSGGGTEPLWSHSGRELYYRKGGDVIGVSVTPGASFAIGLPKTIVKGDFLGNPSHPNYDVSPDGSGFLMLRRAGDEVQTVVVYNWLREVMAKTGGQRR
jgi:serine/threonine-protein kinase